MVWWTMRSPLRFAFAFAALPLVYVACVGDEPVAGTADASTPSDAATTAPLEDRAAPPADASPADAAPACASPRVACGADCVELATSPDHCGACGRSCGGGTCTAGACGVALVRDNIASANGFGVDATSLYFSSADKLFSCPLGACAAATPKQLVAMTSYDADRPWIDSGFMYFRSAPNQSTQRPAIYRCPVDGCPNPPASIVADGLNGIASDYRTFQKSLYANLGGSGVNRVDCSSGACLATAVIVPRPVGSFAVDAQRVYFDDQTGGGAASALVSCPLSGCGTRTPITSTRVLGGIEVVGNLVYFVGPGTTSGGQGVYACPTTGGCASPTPLTRTASPLANLVADAQGIFWTEDDKLLGCAQVACPGGPKTFATGLAKVAHVQLDTKFIYFETVGTTADTRAIKRLAR